MTADLDIFICRQCAVNTLLSGEYYMIHDDLWVQVTGTETDGMLCIGCVEENLGRKLGPDDFTAAPLNDPMFTFFDKSARLLSRITGKDLV